MARKKTGKSGVEGANSAVKNGNAQQIQDLLELLDDQGAAKRLERMAEIVGAIETPLGGALITDEITGLISQSRNDLRSAVLILQKAEETGDVIGPELARAKIHAILSAEQVLHSTLARFVDETLFLEDRDVERQAHLEITAPAHLINLIRLLKTEIKNRTGRPVSDSQVFLATALYAVVNLKDFLSQSLAVGAPVAIETRAVTRHKAGGR